MFIAPSVGLKDGQLLISGLRILASPYKVLGLHPIGEILLCNKPLKLSLSLKAFRMFNFVLRIIYSI